MPQDIGKLQLVLQDIGKLQLLLQYIGKLQLLPQDIGKLQIVPQDIGKLQIVPQDIGKLQLVPQDIDHRQAFLLLNRNLAMSRGSYKDRIHYKLSALLWCITRASSDAPLTSWKCDNASTC